GQRGRQPPAPRHRVVHVVRGDDGQPGGPRQRGEGVVALVVVGVRVVGQLHGDGVGAEQRDEPVQLPRGGLLPVGEQRGGHVALAASGQHEDVVAKVGGEAVEVVDGTTLL